MVRHSGGFGYVAGGWHGEGDSGCGGGAEGWTAAGGGVCRLVGVLGEEGERGLDGRGVGLRVVLLVAGESVADVVRRVGELLVALPCVLGRDQYLVPHVFILYAEGERDLLLTVVS